MNIVLVGHDPEWARKFEREAQVVRAALGDAVTAIHHIGSTAIPGIHAKPVVDMMAEVIALKAVDQQAAALAAEGYEAMGEFGIPGRRYFRKDNSAGVREYQLHVYVTGDPELERHLAFRDYLRSHSGVAQEYSRLKRRLARQDHSDPAAYVSGKDPFIKATESAAVAWLRGRQPGRRS